MFDSKKTSAGFTNRLYGAGFANDSYNRYTYFRLLSQLGTDSLPDLEDKLHLNYANVNAAGQVIPDAQTNFIAWNSLQFFTNAADRLLRKTFANTNENRQLFGLPEVLSLTNLPVVVSNQFVYSASLHRTLQLAANIVDASTNYTANRGGADFPSVFRPTFRHLPNGDIYINGWVEVTSFGAAEQSKPLDLRDPADLQTLRTAPVFNGNVYDVPWVIGAKQGFPNFNEFSIQSVAQIGRKLQLRRPTTASRPNATNQLFTVGVSNLFGFEAWNPYRGNFNRAVQIIVANDLRIRLAVTNDARFDLRNSLFGTNVTLGAVTNIAANAWAGYGNDLSDPERRSFVLPLVTNMNFLPESILRTESFSRPQFVTNMSQGANLFYGFEQTGRFPIPEFSFTTTNRIRFIMLDAATGRVVDYVHLGDLNGVRSFNQELAASDTPVIATGGGNLGQESIFWLTNRAANTLASPPQGIINQLEVSLGIKDVANWNNYGVGVSGQTKQQAIDGFRSFVWGGGTVTNLVMQAPFTPVRKTSQYITWQANDPLVHYTAGDLLDLVQAQNNGIVRENPSGPMATLANLGDLNTRFEPWGGNPRSSAKKSATVPPFSLLAKDPGVRAADDWNFPTNKFASVGWLGRVHRGTPWQTVYLKASTNLNEKEWTRWTGNPNRLDAEKTMPVNDRVIFDVFTTAFDANTARGRLNVNQDGLAAWSAVLGGVIGLTNNAPDAQLYATPPRPSVAPAVLEPAGLTPGAPDKSPLGWIWQGIHNARARQPQGYFAHLGDVLSAPELTEQSPLLNQSTDAQKQYGIDDATYERLPQMIMGLLKGDENPRFAIYAYGQSLKPANNSIVRSGDLFGLCTNYQITAEFATRTVVRIEGTPAQPRAVVESFNILPPD